MTTLSFVIVGILLGLYVPNFSQKIIKYKEKEILNNSGFLFSRTLQVMLCLFNGAIWYMSAINLDNRLIAMLIGVIITTGIVTALVDICIRIIPNEIVLFLGLIGVIYQISYYGPKSLIAAFISMFVMMAMLTAVAGIVGFGKVGAGDVKLAGAMGLILGYPLIIIAVMAMAAVLLVFIGGGLLFKKIYLSTMLPMAPFIVSGMIIALLTVVF